MGRFSASQRYHRPIVAKFTYYKDKELVRHEAPKRLIGSRFRVKEHFPPEIEEKRKLLYNDANMARRNPNNRVKIVRDKLYVNDRQFIPGWSNPQDEQFNAEGPQDISNDNGSNDQSSGSQADSRNQQNGESDRNYYSRNGDGFRGRGTDRGSMRDSRFGRGSGSGRGSGFGRDWGFGRGSGCGRGSGYSVRRGNGFGHVRGRGRQGTGRNDYSSSMETPVRNRFDVLQNGASAWSVNEQSDETWDRQSQHAGKRKPTSPVDTDISTKRQTDSLNSGYWDTEAMDHEQARADTVIGSGDLIDLSAQDSENTRL